MRNGRCHCGAVEFTVRLIDGLNTARRCNCSLCEMRGAIAVSATVENFIIVKGEGALSEYRFNTLTARHYFCSQCGIYTHHQRRSNPEQVGVNVACLDDVSPFDLSCVEVLEGRSHPRDESLSAQASVFGILIFKKADDHEKSAGHD